MATVHVVETRDGWVGFGEWLRKTREARGLTLDDITRETKIPLRNIEALEHGRLERIPAFYRRAEVRAIARALGVDEWLAVGRLDSAVAPAVAESAPDAPRPTPRLKLAASIVALALGALLVTATETGRATFGRNAAARLPVTADRLEPAATVSQPSSDAALLPIAVSHSEASPVVEASTGTFAQLVVRTEPPGARVTVNGIGWGVSPVTIGLPPGEKHVRVTKEGFAGAERAVALDDGERHELDFRLRTVE